MRPYGPNAAVHPCAKNGPNEAAEGPPREESTMKPTATTLKLTLFLALSLVATACDFVGTSDEEDEEPGLEVVSAQFDTTSDLIRVDFSAPLVESTVTRGAFRIVSSLDNGRGSSFTPESVTYLGGETNTVEMRLWGGRGVGNGEHALVVTGVQDVDGRDNVVRYSFTHRVTVRTPKSFIVRKIVVTEFPATAGLGNEWDALSDGPDIRISFHRPNATPIYVSRTFDNASPNTTYAFEDAASFDDPGLPFEADYDKEWQITMVDNDFGEDETMLTVDVRFSSYYRLNNATSDEVTVSSRRPQFTATIHGDWTY